MEIKSAELADVLADYRAKGFNCVRMYVMGTKGYRLHFIEASKLHKPIKPEMENQFDKDLSAAKAKAERSKDKHKPKEDLDAVLDRFMHLKSRVKDIEPPKEPEGYMPYKD